MASDIFHCFEFYHHYHHSSKPSMSVFADNVLAYLPGLAISNLITDCTALRVQPYCSRWNQILMLNCVQTSVVSPLHCAIGFFRDRKNTNPLSAWLCLICLTCLSDSCYSLLPNIWHVVLTGNPSLL